MKNLRKLLPGAKREPKILVIFSNRQEDADRSIRYLTRRVAGSPVSEYPIHVYCLEQPLEAARCAHVVVDPDPAKLYQRAQDDLANVWVALSATTWNNVRKGGRIKFLPFTIPPFRGIIGNENGDFFEFGAFPILRHFFARLRQTAYDTYNWWALHLFWPIRNAFTETGHWFELHLIWPTRHGISWLRRKTRDKLIWGTAVYLGKMAWFAERIVPFTRHMFARLPEGRPTPISLNIEKNAAPKSRPLIVPPRSNQHLPIGGISRIEFRDLEWKRATILRVLENSTSRFILFCPPGYTESFDDFLPLFDDPRTFAVTRQSGFREWRPVMIALSPFRALKPKEVSRVAAPIAQVVLVDREKLLHLALPRTLVFGVAWLALFWRANAAGWRSYSVGHNGNIPQQLDYWLEEMLFVKHLYLNPDLQRLADEAPKLTRGSYAFRPDLFKPFRPLPRVLVVAPYLPFPLSHGGAVRIYNICKSLASKVDFIYICFREVTDVVDYEELHKIFRQVYIVDRDEINNQPGLPKQVNHYETSAMRALIGAIANEEAVDLLQIEYTDLAAYREAVPDRPAILVEHDITYTLHRQFTERDASDAVAQEYERWYKFETERLRAFDSVFVMSGQDQDEAVKSGSKRNRTYVIPNGVDLQKFRALPPPDSETEIFYVGSFRHLPNYLGFEELRVKIMPKVWERYPHAKLRVVAGPDHEKHWRNALKGGAIPELDPRIIIHGFVSDLLPLYQTAHIVAVPLPLSAGTNIKVMESLACQRAVVTSPVGAQGLNLKTEFDAVICELGDPFAEGICRLIENPALRDSIARHGRATAEARFGWDAIAREALDAYSLLIRESRARHGTPKPQELPLTPTAKVFENA